MARKNPETAVVSGFFEPISFRFTLLVGSAGLNLCLCDGHLQTSVLRIYPVGVPGALLAGGAAASLTDPGHSFALRASLCSVALSHGACGRSSLGSLHLLLAALPSLPQRAALVGHITQRWQMRSMLPQPKRKPHPDGWGFFWAYTTQFDTMQRCCAQRCIR